MQPGENRFYARAMTGLGRKLKGWEPQPSLLG